jgi:hypothetical protein
MVTGLAKSGTTILFSSIRDAFPPDRECFFEPRTAAEFEHIGSGGRHTNTLTKALLPDLLEHSHVIARFDARVLIVRDPRDQFISGGRSRALPPSRRSISTTRSLLSPDDGDRRGRRGGTIGWCAFSTSLGRTRSGMRISWMEDLRGHQQPRCRVDAGADASGGRVARKLP